MEKIAGSSIGQWGLCQKKEEYSTPAIDAFRSPDGLQVKRLQRTNGFIRIISTNEVYQPLELNMVDFEKADTAIARVALVERRVYISE